MHRRTDLALSGLMALSVVVMIAIVFVIFVIIPFMTNLAEGLAPLAALIP